MKTDIKETCDKLDWVHLSLSRKSCGVSWGR